MNNIWNILRKERASGKYAVAAPVTKIFSSSALFVKFWRAAWSVRKQCSCIRRCLRLGCRDLYTLNNCPHRNMHINNPADSDMKFNKLNFDGCWSRGEIISSICSFSICNIFPRIRSSRVIWKTFVCYAYFWQPLMYFLLHRNYCRLAQK